MIHFRPTDSVLAMADRLEEAGFEAWCVGGAVRDALLGGDPLDWDLATTAYPEQVRTLFGYPNTIPVGIEFGTVIVLDDARVPHEVTTFRRDVTSDGRHAEVEFGASLDDDLARRDFTINAIAYRPRTSELRDPFDGRADLERRLVRAVGDPELRMREDRLRALRAMRFASRFDFAIDPGTMAAMRGSAPYLTRLSAERVQQELVKTMEQVDRPGRAFAMWRETGALAALVPSLAGITDVALEGLDRLPRARGGRRDRTLVRLAALFQDVPANATRQAMTALRFSKRDIAWVGALVERWHSFGGDVAVLLEQPDRRAADVRRLLGRLGRPHEAGFLRLCLARWEGQRADGGTVPEAAAVRALHRQWRAMLLRDPLDLSDLVVGGEELRRSGIPAGPIYAKILAELLEFVLEDPARNTIDALMGELPRVVAALGGEPAPALTSTE